MTGLWNLNLIHFLDFYFLFLFFIGTWRRVGQYFAVVRLVVTAPGRWPNLLRLVTSHRTLFFTWSTILPGAFALILSVAQLLASRLVWPEVAVPPNTLTLGKLVESVPFLLTASVFGIAMLYVDLRGVVLVGQIDRSTMEGYFDQAEYWLKSKTAHVVRVFSFGRIDPRRMVADEVQKALLTLNEMVNSTFWWVALQMGLRVAFGLSLWLAWAYLGG